MLIYAGIDEAGYGPMFGPFVIARSVVAIEGMTADPSGEPPAVWELMPGALCRRKSDKRKRIAVNDSKKLYSPSTGMAALERGVLAFAQLAGHRPTTLDELLAAIGHDDESRTPDQLWYEDETGGPTLPHAHTADELAIPSAMLERAATGANLACADLAAAVLYEDRFNRMVAATRSKGRCAWTFVSQHLWAIWQAHGEHHPFVCVDRQGGRKVYHDLLRLVFPDAALQLIDESDDVSRYVLRDERSGGTGRAMTISFETGSEERHLPVALASMTAKYLRELLMVRFNAFWAKQKPELKPTAGYVQDGRRFLAEIETAIDAMGIDRSQLIRSR